MTEEIQQTKQMQNFDFCMKTLEMHCELTFGYLNLAQRLQKIKDERLFEPQWSTFYEFTLEIREMSLSTVDKLLAVYRRYVLEYKLPMKEVATLPWTILADSLPLIQSKEDAIEFLKTPHTRQDIKKTLKEKRSGVKMDECTHEDTYLIRICRTCGDRWREYQECDEKEKDETPE
jgi:hypothetical protein